MAIRKLRVIKRSDGEFGVYPPLQTAKADGAGFDTLRIINKTAEPLLWSVPAAAVAGNVAVNQVVAPNANHTIALDNGADAVFEYQVYMIDSQKKARGNSDPVLIIEV
jgi:ApbE superfamily uncharacterized protein (UPF0280 family)